MGRRILWAGLGLAPATLAASFLFHIGDVALFVLAAASLIPLAWLIGEATEHAAVHTGSRIGGLLNASFGNAPELIIALLAVADGLPNVVRGSLAGSVVGNILLVLGAALLAGGDGYLDRRSVLRQLAIVALAVAAFLIPSIPGFHGNPDRHSLAVLTLPVAIGLLLVYLVTTVLGLRRGSRPHTDEARHSGGWTLPASLAALGAATLVTAFISEILVHALDPFAEAAGLSEFFLAAVIVAIVGNAAEHGGAVVIASRGNIPLATEIAVSSSAQVALLIAPAVALLSFAVTPALPLAFRPVELAAMGGAALFVVLVTFDGRSRRWEGALLTTVYAGVAVAFWVAGDR